MASSLKSSSLTSEMTFSKDVLVTFNSVIVGHFSESDVTYTFVSVT